MRYNDTNRCPNLSLQYQGLNLISGADVKRLNDRVVERYAVDVSRRGVDQALLMLTRNF